jgi:hypothetical protein
MSRNTPTLATLVALIAHSPIVVMHSAERLPSGYDDVDAGILGWIATEGRRIGRGFTRM